MMRGIIRGVDERLGTARMTREVLNKVFPDHWSFLLGEVILYTFIILVGTGVYLTLFFDASQQEVLYAGSYVPLQGVEMSRAYASALDISFSVRSGLVIRQVHHWAALIFAAAMVTHLLRTFFTGAFRKPREMNWAVGVTLLILAMVNGFTGYSMIDDQLSGTGLRIGYSIIISIPLIGPWLSSLLLGGEFPGADILSRLFVLHVMIVPTLIALLLAAHMAILVRQKHTQFPGRDKTENTITGLRLWPTYAMKAVGVFFLTGAVLAGMGGLIQINPIWMFGPFRVADVSSASQPDWYVGWLEGALRLMPAWELRFAPFEIPNPFYPSLVLAGGVFVVLYAWPWLEAWKTGDHEIHHLLDRPSERPTRTSIGLAAIAFFGVLFVAGGDDVIAVWLDISVNSMVRMLQFLAIVLPIAVFFISRSVMRRRIAKREKSGKGFVPKVGHSKWEFRIAFVLVAVSVLFIYVSLSKPSPPALPETWTAEANNGLSGLQMYDAACAQCHGESLEGIFGPALGPGTDSEEMSDTLIGAVVFAGIGTMPPMPGVLTEQQVEDVIVYIRRVQESG
ncbi:MAG: cytochrome b N-terminal domain-containing protein [Actinomycetia bacterium]|nr:cytochrome b N-terminal domain-containing protein [Actinomycetes bacterium]